MKKPLIGLTLDYENSKSYSNFPWYAIRENYFLAIEKAGGIGVALPHNLNDISAFTNNLDGLLITGGNFDIDPRIFGDSHRHKTIHTKENRTTFELQLGKKMLDSNKPVFGICGGQQLINVIYQGTLIQHIPDEIDNAIEHEQTNPRDKPGHEVVIKKDSFLYKIISRQKILVNSAHHQAVKNPGRGLKINARSPDGVIEGIEDPLKNFCIGVQWHPEFLVQNSDFLLFKKFIDSC